MKKLLCPSMMCANFGNLIKEVELLEKAGIDIFHNDIMDGNFVPNFAMGLQDIEYIRTQTEKPIDVHLMIQNPARFIDLFSSLGVDIIYFHPETDPHPTRTIDRIRFSDVKPGIAINPNTSIWTVEPLLPLVEYVLVMTVNPGFVGQKYLTTVNQKIKQLIEYRTNNSLNYILVVDGAISPRKVKELSQIGVEGFVLGTSSLFGKSENYQTIIQKLRNL